MPTRTLTWTALGDSFTAGTGDDPNDGGWLKRMARCIDADLLISNHAVPGATLDDVMNLQLPMAAPATITSAIAGANDLLRYRLQPETLRAKLARLVEWALSTSDHVVLSTCPDFFAHRHGPGCKSSQRVDLLNSFVVDMANRASDRIFVLDTHAVLSDPALWHEDGLHPNPCGHSRLAGEAARVVASFLPLTVATTA